MDILLADIDSLTPKTCITLHVYEKYINCEYAGRHLAAILEFRQ